MRLGPAEPSQERNEGWGDVYTLRLMVFLLLLWVTVAMVMVITVTMAVMATGRC